MQGYFTFHLFSPPNIGVLGLLALMFRRIFLFLVIIVFLLPSILLRVLWCSGLHRVYL
jgi:hypothetical protein